MSPTSELPEADETALPVHDRTISLARQVFQNIPPGYEHISKFWLDLIKELHMYENIQIRSINVIDLHQIFETDVPTFMINLTKDIPEFLEFSLLQLTIDGVDLDIILTNSMRVDPENLAVIPKNRVSTRNEVDGKVMEVGGRVSAVYYYGVVSWIERQIADRIRTGDAALFDVLLLENALVKGFPNEKAIIAEMDLMAKRLTRTIVQMAENDVSIGNSHLSAVVAAADSITATNDLILPDEKTLTINPDISPSRLLRLAIMKYVSDTKAEG